MSFVKLVSIIGLFRFGGHKTTNDHVQTQWLAPSSIHFLQIQENGRNDRSYKQRIYRNGVENGLNNNENGRNNNVKNSDDHDLISSVPFCLPKKLQVTEKDGSFIALDNNSLKLMRHLERLGHCTEVEVEIVPLSKVPPNMVQEVGEEHSNGHLQTELDKKQSRMKCRVNGHQHHHHQVKLMTGNNQQIQFASSQHNHMSCSTPNKNVQRKYEMIELKPVILDAKMSEYIESSESSAGTPTTSTTTTSYSLNGYNTYLSDQQLRSARISNTMTVMAPCLRQPITTSTPASDLSMRHFKWHNCCTERQRNRAKLCQHSNHQPADQCPSGEWLQYLNIIYIINLS